MTCPSNYGAGIPTLAQNPSLPPKHWISGIVIWAKDWKKRAWTNTWLTLDSTWELVRCGEMPAPPHTSYIRVSIFTRSPGESCAT